MFFFCWSRTDLWFSFETRFLFSKKGPGKVTRKENCKQNKIMQLFEIDVSMRNSISTDALWHNCHYWKKEPFSKNNPRLNKAHCWIGCKFVPKIVALLQSSSRKKNNILFATYSTVCKVRKIVNLNQATQSVSPW